MRKKKALPDTPAFYARRGMPCPQFTSAQEPEQPTSVCLNCGHERDKHPICINDVTRRYNEMYKRQQDEYAAWDAQHTGIKYKDRPKYEGFYIDFGALMEMLLKAIQDEYNFTLKQAQHISGKAYEMGHSSGGDIFIYASDLCEFIKGMPKD